MTALGLNATFDGVGGPAPLAACGGVSVAICHFDAIAFRRVLHAVFTSAESNVLHDVAA